jgi:hypothetical protein
MQKPPDDSLARARLAEKQHGRVGFRDLGGLREDMFPESRLTDHAAIARPRVQLVRECPNARLESGGPLGGRVGPLALFEAVLALEAEAVRAATRRATCTSLCW